MPIHATVPGKAAAAPAASAAISPAPLAATTEVEADPLPDLESRLQRAARLGHRVEGIARGLSGEVRRYPYISSDPPAEEDSLIYGIYNAPIEDGDEPIYVGQTTWARSGTRFLEHVNNDKGAPWYQADISGDLDTWPYHPANIERLKEVTRFEVTAAEQYWYEAKGGKDDLYNRSGGDANQPMTKATFEKYKTIKGNYRPLRISLSDNWEPTDG
jgi:hypothetical protein